MTPILRRVLWTVLCLYQNARIEALTPNVTVFEDKAMKDVIRLNEIIRVRSNLKVS